jgi:hypothetical protein
MNYEILNTDEFSNRELDVYGNFLEELERFCENREEDLIASILMAPDDEFPGILQEVSNLFWYSYEEVLDVVSKVRRLEDFDL